MELKQVNLCDGTRATAGWLVFHNSALRGIVTKVTICDKYLYIVNFAYDSIISMDRGCPPFESWDIIVGWPEDRLALSSSLLPGYS